MLSPEGCSRLQSIDVTAMTQLQFDAANNLLSPLCHALEAGDASTRIIVDHDSLSGQGLLVAIAQRQAQFSDHGIKPGDYVVVTTGSGLNVWVDFFALWGLGAVAVACDDDKRFLRHAADCTGAVAISGSAKHPDGLKSVVNAEAACHGASPVRQHAVSREDHALVLFTSGSTGMPKAVPLTHGALCDNALATIDAIGIAHCRHLFSPVPFRFISGISHCLAALLSGVCYQGTEQRLLQAELVMQFIRSGADAFGGSPLQARWLAASAADIAAQLKWIMASGDHFPESVIADLRRDIPGIRVITAYGLTELAGRLCVQSRDDVSGSVGKPISGFDVSIINEDGRAPTGQSGRVYAAGPMVFRGYLTRSGLDASAIDANGFDTGDIGHVDHDGRLWLSGRSDDVFKSGALKVSTQPIVAALMSVDCFDDVAVIAVTDDTLGHVPHVFYRLKPGGEFRRGDVLRVLRRQLDKGYLPRHFTQLDRIPRTASGKVKRGELRALVERAGA